jgi:hypothetical protein
MVVKPHDRFHVDCSPGTNGSKSVCAFGPVFQRRLYKDEVSAMIIGAGAAPELTCSGGAVVMAGDGDELEFWKYK